MIKILFAAAALAVATPAYAEQAPAALRGNSVVVAWQEVRLQRNVGELDFRSVQASHSLSLYVSSVGRVFSRMTFATILASRNAPRRTMPKTPPSSLTVL